MKRSGLKKIVAGLSSACMIAAAALPAASFAVQAADNVLYGDANCDKQVNMADAVMIMQANANPDKYTLTDEGKNNADVFDRGDGITNKDALAIQQYKLGLVKELPVSYKDGGEGDTSTSTTTTTTTTVKTESTTTTTTTTTTDPADPVADIIKIHLEG